jgi:hypothetical protein
LSTVTRSVASSSWKAEGETAASRGTITSRPPNSSAPQISQTEKSKAAEWNIVQTSRAPKSNQWRVAENSRATLAWGTGTPLGRPVEPEV